jgi:acyl carrier protein
VEELHDLYDAYRTHRRKDGGDPCIGRRVPQLLREAGFRVIGQDVEIAHSTLLGDEAFFRAEGVGIPAKLVEDGFLAQATFDRMIKSWKEMLAHPDHSIMRQLFVAVGENSAAASVAAAPVSRPKPAVVTVTAAAAAGGAGLQKSIEEIWCAALRVPRVDARANFFDLGGTSLALMDVQEQLLDKLGREIPMATLFQFPTIEGLARHLSGGAEPETAATPRTAPAGTAKPASDGDADTLAERRREALGKRKRTDIG